MDLFALIFVYSFLIVWGGVGVSVILCWLWKIKNLQQEALTDI